MAAPSVVVRAFVSQTPTEKAGRRLMVPGSTGPHLPPPRRQP